MANGTKADVKAEATAAPTLPGPVEIPEYYAGFGQEFEKVGVELQDAWKTLQSAEQKLNEPAFLQALPSPLRRLYKITAIPYILDAVIGKENRLALTQQQQQEFDLAAQAFQIAEWKLEVMQVMPIYLSDPSYKIEKADDILQFVAPGTTMSDADTAWLNNLYNNMKHLTNTLPEDFQGDVLESQSIILNEILTEPKLELKGVHNLTVDEIAKAFAFSVAELPAGMTEEDVRDMLSKMDLQDEELQSQREWLEERAREWETEAARMSLIRASEILAETPELAPLDWAKLIVTQPMMATVEVMQKWWDAIARPISAAMMIHMPAPASGGLHGAALGAAVGGTVGSIVPVIGTAVGAGIGAIIGAIGGAAWFSTWEDEASKELAETYEFYVADGDNSWSAYAKAFNEWDAPWYKKMILDSAFDPLMWIGWGGVAAVGQKISTMALPRGLKWAGSKVGHLMVAFEKGYIAGADAIFKGAMNVVSAPIKAGFWLSGAGFTIPKTLMQMSRNFGRQGMMDIIAVVRQRFPAAGLSRGKLVGITTQQFKSVLDDIARYALKNPTTNDLMARAGTAALEFSYLGADDVAKMLKGLVDDALLDTVSLSKFNSDILDSISGFVNVPGIGVTHGDRIASANILSRFHALDNLGEDAAKKLVDDLAGRIGSFKENIAKKLVESIGDELPGDAIYKLYNRMVDTRYANLKSPFTEFMQQAGRSVSWHSRVADRVLYSARMIAMERRLVMPIAKQQLLFTNFGPFNYLENSMRSFLGGADALVPRTFGGVDETLEVIGKLSGSPYELVMLQRGEKRLVQSIVNPETGKALVFKGGNLPFITRNVVVPEKIPRFGGKGVGMTLTIGNKKYFLGSAQDWYDMWSDLVGKQLAYDYQVHFTKALYDTPTGKQTIDGIQSILEKNRHLIDDIPSITKNMARDTERLMNWRLLDGPDAIASMADVSVLDYQRRMIGNKYWQKADQMTDIHRIVKDNLYDNILDGNMFKNGYTSIDERFAGALSAERDLQIASLAPQIEAMKDQVDWILANPPRNLDDFMWDMQTLTGDLEALRSTIHDYRKITRLRSSQLAFGEVDDFEAGSAKMLAEYMDTAEEEITQMMNQIMSSARGVVEPLPVSGKALVRSAKEASTLNDRLHAIAKNVVATDDWTLSQALAAWNLHPQNDYLQIIGRSASASTDYINLVQDILSKKYSSGYVRIYRGHSQVGSSIKALEREYINVTSKRAVAREFGVTKWVLPGGEAVDYVDIPVSKIVAIGNPGESELIVRSADIQEFLGRVPTKPILSDAQIAQLTNLDNINRLELNNILATRTKLAEIESEIPAFHKNIRSVWKTNPDKAQQMSQSFWNTGGNSQRFRKAAVWEEFDEIADRLKTSRLMASRNFLQSVDRPVFVPDFIPEVTGDLTANHLAYLYGATGDDLYRGLTRISHHTRTMPRKEFIIHTQEQANAYAAKFGKTADQIGFTEGAIGEVYDQMWRSLGIDPAVLTPDSPTAMQLEELRQEMYRWFAAERIPDSDVVKWRGYVNAVADDARQLDVYKATGFPEVPGKVSSKITYPKGVRTTTVHVTDKGKVTTSIEYYDTPEGIVIDMIHTKPEYLRKGYATKALDEVLRDAESRGLTLYSGTATEEGITFFRGLENKGVITLQDASEQGYTFVVSRKTMAGTGTPDWWATKETAMTKAREMHALAYPTYDDANIIDETMRAIFPFWNYELFRWKWLPRTFMRTPGTMSAVARYMNYSDSGYVPVPGTDLQMNFLRGTVFMGGLRSFYLRDFPEFHDAIPGIEFLDYIGRAGFFPGIHVMGPIVGLSSIASGQKLQWGELAPAWLKTSLSGLRALSPEHIGKVLDVIYPDRFRDYMTMMELASMGYDGDEIWKKKQQDIKLTEEEEKLWLQAVNKVDGIKGILMNQTGLFRIRPAEFTQLRQEMRLAIEEATGVPVATQEWIDKMYPVTGKRFTDYFHLDIQQQALLYQWESYRRYQGITEPLYPSSWQALDIKTSDYYDELEKIYTDARYNGVYDSDGNLIQQSMTEINRQLVEGIIGPDQWRSLRSGMQDSLAEAVRILGESPAYADVPKTFEERAALLAEKGIVTPTQTPDQELLYYYYELKPELKYNWESDRMELDFDTYYGYIDILLETLSPPFRERLLQRIQSDWTPMEQLYWQFSRDFGRPYRNLRQVVMNEYTDEQVQIIRRYEVARGDEREQLQEVIGPDGKLIAGYQARLREARQRLRLLDPTLDAWLYFFGTTDTFMSTESKEIYEKLTEQYLTSAMIGEAK